MELSDITVLTCNFNNSYITMRMIESLYTQLKCDINLMIIDNSTTDKINDICKKYFNVIDNTNFKYTTDYNQASKNHCCVIDYALKNCIKTKYVMLCDNDILFKPEIVDFINMRHDFDVIGEINYDYILPERILPFCTIIDVEKFNNENLNYFDNDRCMLKIKEILKYPVKIENNIFTMYSNEMFDTGSSFYIDIRHKWNIKDIKLNNYIEHYRSGSHKNERSIEKEKFNIVLKYNNIDDFYNKNKQFLSIV